MLLLPFIGFVIVTDINIKSFFFWGGGVPFLSGHLFLNILQDIQGYGMTLVTPDNSVDTRPPPAQILYIMVQ